MTPRRSSLQSLRGTNGMLAHLVDRAAARRDLGLAEERDNDWWIVPGGWLPAFWLRRVHQLGAHSGWVVPLHRKGLRRAGRDSRLVLVRVDDSPRWDRPLEEFLTFDSLMAKYGIPYALGVTPFLSISPRVGRLEPPEIDTLQRLTARGVTLAQHGFTHRPHRWVGRFRVELPAYSSRELVDWIDRADSFYDSSSLPRPEIMIPPFDGITPESLTAISDRYGIVTGGPASLTTLGPVAPGVRVHHSVYLPSYYPHMYATRLYPRLGERLWMHATGPVVVLTLHWAWEVRDGYQRVESLLAALAGHVAPWAEASRRFDTKRHRTFSKQ